MCRGIIYYTDNRVLDKPIIPIVRRFIAEAGLPIVSVSIKKPIKFGKNIFLQDKKRGAYTWALQILTALKESKSRYIFFCEHDVLYHKSHFDFTPPRDDTYYYNVNVWRWRYNTNLCITHDDIKSVSGLCCNRELAINHYKRYLDKLDEREFPHDAGNQPRWLRKLGFEPGTTSGKMGMPFEPVGRWKSEYPNVDIRHKRCFTNRKTNLKSCKKKPVNWQEHTVDDIPGWNIRELLEQYGFKYIDTSKK